MRLAVGERNLRWRNLQIVGKQPNYSFVRFAVSRCCSRANPQRAIADVENFIATCSRLDSDAQHEIVTRPNAAQFSSILKMELACNC